MEKKSSSNTYEEARKQRVLDNKKRFENLGILSLSKDLSDISTSRRKQQSHHHHVRLKRENVYSLEPRRSSRARNPVPSYRDDIDADDLLPRIRKRSSQCDSSWTSYLARPLEEVRSAQFEERASALKSAEKLLDNLQSVNPSFIKSMVRSHVYSCFWLGLPTRFCEDHLPKCTAEMVLEDEEGSEYDAVYIGKRTGISGGWRAFALDHKLDDGDALVFELVEPTRFKIYIVRASESLTGGGCEPPGEEDAAKPGIKKKLAVTKEDEAQPPVEEETNKPGKKKKLAVTKKDDCKATPVLRRCRGCDDAQPPVEEETNKPGKKKKLAVTKKDDCMAAPVLRRSSRLK